MLELIFIKLLEISLQANFLILAVLLLRFLFKGIPKNFVCLLWMLVAARLIFPFEITSSFSLVPDTSRLLELAVPSGNAEITSGTNPSSGAEITSGTNLSGGVEITFDTNPSGGSNDVSATTKPEVVNSGNTSTSVDQLNSAAEGNNLTNASLQHVNTSAQAVNFSSILTVIWIIGTAALLSYGLISYIRTKYLLSEAVRTDNNTWLSDRIETPFVLGYFKPRIYIPFSVTEAQLPYIIAHEKAHIAHLDHFGKITGYLLLSLYWFNPFVWAAYYFYCKDLELACDERVINTLGPDAKRAYSEALLTCSVSNKALLQSPLAFSELGVRERIINILNYKEPRFWGVVAAILLCVMTAVCFLTNPQTSNNSLSGERSETGVTESETDVSLSADTETPSSDVISTENETESSSPANLWAAYADQINAFPGEVKQDDNGNLIVVMNTADYEAVVTTDQETGAPAYIWREPNTKTYPLEIVNETLQDVPARIISREELLHFPYGEALLQQISKLYPSGIYQFILRENGILHVNVGQEDGTFLNLQYLEYTVSEDGQTAVLQASGIGYYLLQINDVEALEAFRRSFTGEGHTLPADTSHLPWDWLLAMNGEENDAPEFTTRERPVAEHLYMYDYFTGYNIQDIYNGFYIYEKRDADKLLYECRYYDEAGDIVIITDPSGTRNVTTIHYNGKEVETDFRDIFHFGGAAGSYACPYLADVTGDGRPELLLESGGGGTGAFYTDIYIYQLDSLEQLSIDTNIYDITSRLSLTLTQFLSEEGRLRYLMEYDGQTAESDIRFDSKSEKHAKIMAPGVTPEETEAYFSHDPISEIGQNPYSPLSFNSETNRLEATVGLAINNTTPLTYIGNLRFTYIWDEKAGEFVPDPESVILTGY